MSVSEQQKFKLLVLQIRFLKEKLSLHKQIENEAAESFSKSFHNTLKDMPEPVRQVFKDVGKVSDEERERNEKDLEKKIEQAKQARANVKNEDRSIEPKKAKPKHLKSVYKDIAKVTHPDKLKNMSEIERLEKENLFIKAKKALEEENFIDLMDVALHLKIKFPDPTEADIVFAKNRIEKIRNKIKKLENTTAWKWYHSDEEDRPLIMKDYINYIYHTEGG
tara:strand:+ start:1216 stop:1878 length:663 start_codon:yes stop_codon:yes gene_type:complete